MLRRSLFTDHAFDTDDVNFGSSAAAIGGEDAKLMQDLVQAGEQIFHVPDAWLRHIVQPNESKLSFILKRQMRIGRGNAIVEGGGALAVVRKCVDILAYTLITPFLFLLGKRASSFQQVMKIARRLGMLQVWATRNRR